MEEYRLTRIARRASITQTSDTSSTNKLWTSTLGTAFIPQFDICTVTVLTHRSQVESSTPNITAFASRGGKILQCE
jgi:hypothetical protein